MNAAEVFGQTINSSNVSKDFVVPEFKDREALERIYEDIQNGVAFEMIDWPYSPGDIEEFHHDFADKFLNLIRG
jgi:hypothetical protein